MNDLKQLSRAIIIAGACIGLGLATPAIIAAVTQHDRYSFSRISGSQNILAFDKRTGDVCYPTRPDSEWRGAKRKCRSIEVK